MPSTVINHFSYNKDLKTLKIIFITGMVYKYLNVPKRTFEMLKAAGSKGRYFNHYIKDKFDFEKIDEV
ncbi:KTSC domain-containing protein [Pedobacter rhodius]|uniref:KTSC domain-containing protein n=1 Tax=Pedobacter rhodius TaxID=3004098 RepID=A0ABT4KVV0_9SPHI|nr:KTSC domain-containing protein [Pedobacter sp. SJ11]MCZ4223058.1 KTSC domain-containing protein [Pedobacter sp. SJ11]